MSDVSKTNELIAELRDYATALRASVLVHHTGADLIEQAADALATRVPVQGEPNDVVKAVIDRDVAIASIAGGTISVPGGYGVLHGDDAANIVDAIIRHATVPDAATEGRMSLAELEDTAETHAFCADRLFIETELVDEIRAERDAALAAIDRVRAVVKSIRFLAALPPFDEGNTVINAAADDIVAALDGAPEPEREACRASWDCPPSEYHDTSGFFTCALPTGHGGPHVDAKDGVRW